MNQLVVRTWEVPSNLTWEDWQSRMRDAAIFQKKWAWYLGDLLNYGIDHFGEKAWQLISNIKLAHETLMNYKSVAGKIAVDERNAEVPFTIYQDICSLPRPERDRIVSGYLGGSLNRADIRAFKVLANGNGGSNGSDVPMGLPSAKEAAFEACGLAMVACAKVMRKGVPGLLAVGDTKDLKEALDELIASAISLKAVLD